MRQYEFVDAPTPPAHGKRMSMYNFDDVVDSQESPYSPRSFHPKSLQRQSVAITTVSRTNSPAFEYQTSPYPPCHSPEIRHLSSSPHFVEDTASSRSASTTPSATSTLSSSNTRSPSRSPPISSDLRNVTPPLPSQRLSVLSSCSSRPDSVNIHEIFKEDTVPELTTMPGLEHPIAIPQAAAGAGLPFSRAYAPILEYYSIDMERFLSFVDGLNKACSTPSKQARYLQDSNDVVFQPRGMRVSVLTSQQLATRLGFFDWTEMASPLTQEQMSLSVQERKLVGIQNKVSTLQFVQQQQQHKQQGSSSREKTASMQNRELMNQRRRTMIHQDWFDPLEAYKTEQMRGDKEMEATVKRLSGIQVKANKTRDKKMLKLDKAKHKEFGKMDKRLSKELALMEKDNRKAIENLSRELKKKLDGVTAEIKEYEDVMRKREIDEKYVKADPAWINMQRTKREIINKYKGFMDQEMELYLSEKKRREHECNVEKFDYDRAYQEEAAAVQKSWDREMGRTGNNKRDKELELLEHTRWLVVDAVPKI